MAKSPGHQKWPNHKVEERHLGERWQVKIGDKVVAESSDVIRVDEDEHPARYYFPRADVQMDKLARTDTETQCPYKGTAHYFSLNVDGKSLSDAVWTYEQPFEEHTDLKDRVAFYDDKLPEIVVKRS